MSFYYYIILQHRCSFVRLNLHFDPPFHPAIEAAGRM